MYPRQRIKALLQEGTPESFTALMKGLTEHQSALLWNSDFSVEGFFSALDIEDSIIQAAFDGDVIILTNIVEQHPEMNLTAITDIHGNTLLHIAASQNRLEMVRHLLYETEQNIMSLNNFRATALDIANTHYNYQEIHSLLENAGVGYEATEPQTDIVANNLRSGYWESTDDSDGGYGGSDHDYQCSGGDSPCHPDGYDYAF